MDLLGKQSVLTLNLIKFLPIFFILLFTSIADASETTSGSCRIFFGRSHKAYVEELLEREASELEFRVFVLQEATQKIEDFLDAHTKSQFSVDQWKELSISQLGTVIQILKDADVPELVYEPHIETFGKDFHKVRHHLNAGKIHDYEIALSEILNILLPVFYEDLIASEYRTLADSFMRIRSIKFRRETEILKNEL
jgi:hypothetical protein